MILTFASTIHDPENRLDWLIDEVGLSLRGLFNSAIVSYTPKTHLNTVNLLIEKGYSVYEANDTVLNCYQMSLRNSLDSNVDVIFYCDLDRALHWIKYFPEEINTIIKKMVTQDDFILLGRTRRAFETHPDTQSSTEGIANLIVSKILGFTNTRDVLSATWILNASHVGTILKFKSENRFGFYAEWPIILWRVANHPNYIEVEGLEWETPDRYTNEIGNKGFEDWKRSYQTQSEWRKRCEMLRDFIDSSLKYHQVQ